MNTKRTTEAVILGALLCVGLTMLGWLLSSSAFRIKEMDRTVVVKGLERSLNQKNDYDRSPRLLSLQNR